jgi:hypothetical protein
MDIEEEYQDVLQNDTIAVGVNGRPPLQNLSISPLDQNGIT